jgi:SPP1 family predicted phage head-tail adaptor
MLTDADLTSMRATAAQALPGTAVIQTRSFTDDGGGGGTLAWSNAGTVACRLAPLNGSEREIADRVSDDSEFIATLPTTAAVDVTKRLLINGGTFNVSAVRDRSWEITQRVEVVREA